MNLSRYFKPGFLTFFVLFCGVPLSPANAAGEETNYIAAIAKIKPSIVAIGTFEAERNPSFQFSGTGFVIGDGSVVATNSHVVPTVLDSEKMETIRVAIPVSEGDAQLREASIIARDVQHDLVLLRLTGAPLPALALADSDRVREGQMLGFTGFPFGAQIGLYPTTHRALVSTITPAVLPQASARRLDPAQVSRLRTQRFNLFQLDATAYPGNSGSPLFDPASGEVVGIINMVVIKAMKEGALPQQSGITYSIPANHLRNLLNSPSLPH